MKREMPSESVLLFVDAVEDDDAWVVLGESRHRIARAVLPPGAGEGSWLRLSIAEPPAEAKNLEERRAKLVRDDPGGTIKL
jgi:hypothetical protein